MLLYLPQNLLYSVLPSTIWSTKQWHEIIYNKTVARECRIARFFGNKHLGRSLKGKHSWNIFFTFPQHRLFVLLVFVQSFPATEFWLASARNFRTLSFWVIWWGLLNERMRINYKWSHFWAPHCKTAKDRHKNSVDVFTSVSILQRCLAI